MLELNAKTTALVVIDLQEGILPFAGGPHTADEVVNRAGKLAAKFRASGQPVFLVRVGWSADYAEALKQPVDAPSPAKVLPENWWQHPAALGATDSDIEIIKRQWGAFYGTDLELQLRRRGIDTIVLCGISTNIGVESTARNAWELGFNLVIAEDPVVPPAPSSTITVSTISTRASPVCVAWKRSSTRYDLHRSTAMVAS
ncbi:isochorismatase family protein [Escherichia coli 201600.1]|nr:isochorismatase family protein [Escherichia coli 201600.1]